MVRQFHTRYGRAPGAWLADAGFLRNSEIGEFGGPGAGTTLHLPVRTPEVRSRDPYLPLPADAPAVAAWRTRMGTPEAKKIYKDRAATAVCVNAIPATVVCSASTFEGARRPRQYSSGSLSPAT
jgi:hypothetical protein